MTKEPLLLLFGSFFTFFIRQKEGIRSKKSVKRLFLRYTLGLHPYFIIFFSLEASETE